MISRGCAQLEDVKHKGLFQLSRVGLADAAESLTPPELLLFLDAAAPAGACGLCNNTPFASILNA